MDIQKKLEELEARHAQEVVTYQAAQRAMDNARTMLVKLEGAMDVLRELQAESHQEAPEA